MTERPRIAIIGAGGIGGNVGGALAAAGLNITLIDQWPEHVDAIKRDGLVVIRGEEQFHCRPNALHLHELQRITVPFDYAFISVKAYDTEWATMLLRPYVAAEGAFVDFQKGVNDETVAAIAGRANTLGAIVVIGAACVEPGTVLRTDNNPIGFKVGELDGTVTKRVRDLTDMLGHVAKSAVTTNLSGERWSKLMINCMNYGVAGLTGWGTAEVRELPEPRRVGIQLGAETVSVAQALGYELEPVLNIEPNALVDAAQGRNTQEVEASIAAAAKFAVGGRPSLLQDTMKGRRTEIEYLNGLVSRKGREVGIQTPFNDLIVDVVNDLGVGFTPGPEHLRPLTELLKN